MSKKQVKKEASVKKAIPTPPTDHFRHNSTVHKLGLLVVALLVYGWTYSFDYGIDDKFITGSLSGITNDWSGLIQIFNSWFAGADYRPISILSFWIERRINGELSPHLSHFVNSLLFGAILIMIYEFIVVSGFYTHKKKAMALALLCSIIFAVHPNHVGVVANIKARDNLLSMLWGLIASIQLIQYFDTKKIFRVVLFVFFMLLALLSKLDAYIFIVVPLLIFIFFRQSNLTLSSVKSPVILTFILFLITVSALGILKTLPNTEAYIFSMGFDENPLVAHDTLINRLSVSMTSLFYYYKFLIIPTGYYFFWGYNQIPLTHLFSSVNFISISTTLILLLLSFRYYNKNRIYLFSLLFFLLGIGYALNIVTPVAGIVMDKYNFIPSMGFALALSAGVIDLWETTLFKSIRYFILPMLILFFTFFTLNRTKDWRNSFTLIQKDMPYLTQSVNANRMAGAAYINAALAEELKPSYNRQLTDSLIAIGEQYTTQGLNIYDKVADLWELKGLCAFYKKDYTQALHYFLKAKETDSTYLSGINYVGYAYWSLNRIDSAEYYFNYVIQREPVYDYAANNMLNMYLQNKRDKVDSLLQIFQQRYPDDIWLNQRLTEINKNNLIFKK